MVTRNRNLDKRTNWFDRQFVRAQDFVDADDYELDRRRRHVRLLHTPGVAEGLLVGGNPGDTLVTVGAGTAVDTLGREIVVLLPLPPAALPAGPASAAIYLVYNEVFDDPSTDPGVDGFTRIREIATVAVRKLGAPGDDPVPESPGDPPVPGILLAVVSLDAGQLIATPDNSVRSVAGAVIGVAAVDGISLRRPDHSPSDYPRITAENDTGDILFLAGSPPSEHMRVSAAGHVGIGTQTPLPGALTLEDPSAPLFLRQAGGPTVGGAWRAAVGNSALRLDANTAAAGDFSSTMNLIAASPVNIPATQAPTVTVGSGGNVVLQTRHVYGKSATDDGNDVLYLNVGNDKNVEVGSDAHPVTLLAHGEVAARNFPADDQTPAVAALSLVSRLKGGATISWKMYTGAVGGGGAVGLAPAAYELWQYGAQDPAGEVRFAIRDNGDTYLTPRRGQLFSSAPLITLSDARLKEDVAPLVDVLGKLAGLRGVSYLPLPSSGRAGPAERRALGVIAQEVERVFPELVGVSGMDGHLAVNYGGLTAVLVEAVKEITAEVGRLRALLPDRGEEPA